MCSWFDVDFAWVLPPRWQLLVVPVQNEVEFSQIIRGAAHEKMKPNVRKRFHRGNSVVRRFPVCDALLSPRWVRVVSVRCNTIWRVFRSTAVWNDVLSTALVAIRVLVSWLFHVYGVVNLERVGCWTRCWSQFWMEVCCGFVVGLRSLSFRSLPLVDKHPRLTRLWRDVVVWWCFMV